MNTDVKTLLDRAANDGQPIDPVIDYASDLRRARSYVHRRRSARFSAVGATLLVAALVPVGISTYGSDEPTSRRPSAAQPSDGRSSSLVLPELVAYRGTQAKGFHLEWVPAGWVIVSSDDSSVVVAPKRGADPNPQMVDDKIEVSVLADPDLRKIRMVPPPGEDKKWKAEGNRVVRVHGREGYIHDAMMDFQASNGRWVHIQLPQSLSEQWAPAKFTKFAAGISVTKRLGAGG